MKYLKEINKHVFFLKVKMPTFFVHNKTTNIKQLYGE